VKVRHPNVEEQIGMDFIIMKWLASLVDRTKGLEWLKLSETMSQFSATIASQTDLEVEGRHLYLFNHYFKKWNSVSFPKPIILTGSILVESFEFGDSVDKYTKTISCDVKPQAVRENNSKVESGRKQDEISLTEILRKCDLAHFIVTAGEDTYLKMLLQDNLMHADLHPGNILIQQYNSGKVLLRNDVDSTSIGNKEPLAVTLPAPAPQSIPVVSSSTRIVLVDAGMVARLVPEEQKNFIGLLESMGEGRGDEAANHVMKFSVGPKYTQQTKISFRKDMKKLFSTDCKGYGNNVDIGEALRGILNLVRIHQITIDANYATLVMNCLCLDGMARSLLPTYNILDGAKPLLRFNRIFKRIPGKKYCYFYVSIRASLPDPINLLCRPIFRCRIVFHFKSSYSSCTMAEEEK
jgi:aarF domain-containing kinase